MNTLLHPHERDGILDPIIDCLTPEVASRMLAAQVDPQVQSRVNLLAERARQGLLTKQERLEYEDLVERADFVGLLKGLARRVLAKRPA
jgi:hypothetical protein